MDTNKSKRGEIAYQILFPDENQSVESQHESVDQVSDVDLIYSSRILDDDSSFIKLINATRRGLPFKSLSKALVVMPFSIQEWADILHISTRSIDRLKKERKKLNISQSEKLIEITLLYDYGVDVFGSSEKFSKWLNRSSIALGGLEPKSLLDTNQGIQVVKSELSKIEYGVLA